MPLSHRLAALTAAGVLAAAGLTGCSESGEASGSGSSSRAGAEGAVGKAAFDNAGKPVVKGTFDSPAAQGAKVDIAIMGLRVKGKLATLNVQFTPHVPGAAPGRINAYGLNGDHGLGTSLIDPVNLKRYVVVKDSSGKELETDDIFTHMTNDQVTPFYFTFAAPPENVKTIDVQIGSWPTFRDIPVER
ncbi:hypothetical protein LUW76_16090 [Actinomadura madurae]|uniref:hypothetical protein n=1 Tax=Actinomadura madurae TaxID=1993 RepID=UPI002026151D|nr:hypothetical protein [Actinomadura madurae]URM95728.1 hypothetical protein LUW76_16090 [Actinomadura madurae]URN06427.1 hypothetical protein LUW74_25965 [Actinomadura madurae]